MRRGRQYRVQLRENYAGKSEMRGMGGGFKLRSRYEEGESSLHSIEGFISRRRTSF